MENEEIGHRFKNLRPQDYGISGPDHIRMGPKLSKFIEWASKYAPGPVITARSDTTTIEVGRGLSQEELDYIHALIKKVMTE